MHSSLSLLCCPHSGGRHCGKLPFLSNWDSTKSVAGTLTGTVIIYMLLPLPRNKKLIMIFLKILPPLKIHKHFDPNGYFFPNVPIILIYPTPIGRMSPPVFRTSSVSASFCGFRHLGFLNVNRTQQFYLWLKKLFLFRNILILCLYSTLVPSLAADSWNSPVQSWG